MTNDTVFGWTFEQWGYAKQRHKAHSNIESPADSQGLLIVQAWWRSHNWPEPLSVRIEGVELEKDEAWAAKAIKNAKLINS